MLEGTENEFTYEQVLYYYKDDIEKINGKNKCSFFFTPDGWLQNPHNSLDIAYTIETLLATLEKRVKKRNPETIDDLKKITLEEWNKISPRLVRRYCLNFLKRIKKISEINGNRLEPFHLNQIKKEIDD